MSWRISCFSFSLTEYAAFSFISYTKFGYISPFEDSGCYKVALKSVGSDNPEAKASDILIGALKSTGKTINTVVKPLVCVGAPVLFTVTGVGAPLSAAIVSTCGAVATATNVVKGAKDAVKSSKTTTQMSTTEVEVN